MWRAATETDDDAIVVMFEGLTAEDPGPDPAPPEHMRRTLAAFRAAPARGRVAVLDTGDGAAGYALLVPFWSNEYGGEICIIDELYVAAPVRGRGHASALIAALAAGTSTLWPGRPAALAVEVSAGNARARALYERLGFAGDNTALMARLDGPAPRD